MSYETFLERKRHAGLDHGFAPTFIPDQMFDFQAALTEWAVQKGRAAMFADCGLGKTLMQLTWAENVRRHTGRAVLVLTPLAVGAQTVAEGQRFGIDAMRSRDGKHGAADIVVTNYEQLDKFAPTDFAGVVCDESSILKHFTGATQKQVTRFLTKVPYRLLCTATAAPNDYAELGTSSEALGAMGMVDMLSRFFKQDSQQSQLALAKKGRNGLGFTVAGTGNGWRLKGHAVEPFWQWVASWARAARKPSDLGFSDDGFVLPPLHEVPHVLTPRRPKDGMLFTLPAVGLNEEREERRRTLDERVEMVAGLVSHDQPALVWCHMNAEAEALMRAIPGAVEVSGAHSPEQKEEAFLAFTSGQARVLISKPKVGAWGLNFQHCNHVVTFASHSFEQYYQSVRRCWRFGQQRPVTVDIVATDGEKHVLENMTRKAAQADAMFAQLVTYMHQGMTISRDNRAVTPEALPSWL